MKQLLYFLILMTFLQSCDLIKSNDKLLTQNKWVLHNRFYSNYENGESTNHMEFYKKSDQVLTLVFNTNGTVRITEDNGNKNATIRWNWKSDEQKYITLDKGQYTGDFHILELTGDEFKWSKSDINSSNTILETFKHIEDIEWDDEKIKSLNGSR